jgi:hypothetical protein
MNPDPLNPYVRYRINKADEALEPTRQLIREIKLLIAANS